MTPTFKLVNDEEHRREPGEFTQEEVIALFPELEGLGLGGTRMTMRPSSSLPKQA